ncbi:MAG: glycosyl hydrolase family 95 catalytic domain-containing protein [Kiritimatiellia bacterium]|jgi:alpha-L-fucosidase 2
MDRTLNWRFPLPRTHTGALLGNGLLGVMVWGGERTLRVTFGRGDLWDHRGGLHWTSRQNFRDIRRHLETNNEAGITEIFRPETEQQPGQPERPSIIPVGRVDFVFRPGCVLRDADLSLGTGLLSVRVVRKGEVETLVLALDPERPTVRLRIPDALRPLCRAKGVPAWDRIRDELEPIGFAPPKRFEGKGLTGWVQPLPADPAVCVGWRDVKDGMVAAVVRGRNPVEACHKTEVLAAQAAVGGAAAFEARTARFWKAYWRDVPKVVLPNPALQEIYDYGMYKFGAMTAPTGVAAGLQGPWIEEYQLPPWSADYHFNINVQMCYWPAYRGNRLQHLMPLFDLVHGWLPVLRDIAKRFADVDDGYMLPHAVDDRCTCMGSFWTGCIDHACTAWVAQMGFDYFRCTGDRKFLRTRAFPFMKGAMRVYQAMMEKDGEALALPVSVSPEYRGCRMDAWGRNASFQLASVHRLAENLLAAAKELRVPPDPAWEEILERLPKAAIVGEGDHEQIGLWEGLVLEESHRHHSHLGGIVPFDTLDLDDPVWRRRIENSLRHWTHRGMGLWSGWCMPWASMIHSRVGNGDMAELVLEIWKRVFTNMGRGTLHDADFGGFTLLGGASPFTGKGGNEVMQMDAGMGAVAAVQEMLAHERRGVIHVFRGAPGAWRDAAFRGMLLPGGFRISAEKRDGALRSVTVKADRAGRLRLANPWAGRAVKIVARRNGKVVEGDFTSLVDLPLRAGDRLVVSARKAR